MYGGGLSEVDYSVMQLDGTTDGRAFALGVDHFILDQQGTGWLVADTLGQNVYGFDIEAGTLTPPAPLVSGSVAMTNNVIVRCVDRYLRATLATGVLTLEATNNLTISGSWTAEATLSGFGSSGFITPSRDSPSGTGLYLSSSGTTGEVCHYDTGTKTFSGGFSYLPQNPAAWYSPDLGVFVVVMGGSAPTISIYATSPNPSALSNPVASGGITAGDLANVSVTLTGSNGEPCPGELITWVLTAGDGELIASQSATDATGKATIGYLPPFVVTTNPTIQASVNF
jgi:hypothetical protein